MKKRKWLLPLCIVGGIVALCLVVMVALIAYMGINGYGMTSGYLYIGDTGTFLIEDNNTSMKLSDQSAGKNVFVGLTNGDKVLVIHNGVEESLPARTGAYHIFRIAKGDENYKPSDEALGIEHMTVGNSQYTDDELLENMEQCQFEAQYIRTDGYHDGVKYPIVKIIRSVDELTDYYAKYKDTYYLERRTSVYSDTTIGFLDACDKYDESYFDKQILIMVLLEEGSGSITHKVNGVGTVDSKLIVDIDTIIPEAGTDDMAEWHILIEPVAGVEISSVEDVVVFLDGQNATDKKTEVSHSKGYGNITVQLLNGWTSTVVDHNDTDFSIYIWPEDQPNGKLRLQYTTAFGVCGTGLEQRKISLGNYEAWQGTYDNAKLWDFINIIGTPGSYVIMNEGASAWWDEYESEALSILSTIKVSDGVTTEAEAIEIAKAKATVEYDEVSASFDINNGIWTVNLFKKNTAGGDQTIQISADGNIVYVSYGE